MSLDEFEIDIINEVTDWAKSNDMVVENPALLLSHHVLRLLSKDIPKNEIKVLDISQSPDRVFVNLPHLIEGDITSPLPKRIGKIYTQINSVEAQKDPSIFDHAVFIDELIYLSDKNDYLAKFDYDNRVMFVPSIPTDNDDIYVEFLYPWTNLNQLPNQFRDLVVYACRYEIVTQLLNSMLFSNYTSSSMRGDENRGDHPAFQYGEELLNRVKADYTFELDFLFKTYNNFDHYRNA